jgi:hypothetical protein
MVELALAQLTETTGLGVLGLVPLVGLPLGYGLGSWRSRARTKNTDQLAFLLLIVPTAAALAWALRDARGLYLALGVGGVGCASMFARTTGLTRLGFAVATVVGLAVGLLVLAGQLLTGENAPGTEASWQGCLRTALFVGLSAQGLVAVIISQLVPRAALWDKDRDRHPELSSESGGGPTGEAGESRGGTR